MQHVYTISCAGTKHSMLTLEFGRSTNVKLSQNLPGVCNSMSRTMILFPEDDCEIVRVTPTGSGFGNDVEWNIELDKTFRELDDVNITVAGEHDVGKGISLLRQDIRAPDGTTNVVFIAENSRKDKEVHLELDFSGTKNALLFAPTDPEHSPYMAECLLGPGKTHTFRLFVVNHQAPFDVQVQSAASEVDRMKILSGSASDVGHSMHTLSEKDGLFLHIEKSIEDGIVVTSYAVSVESLSCMLLTLDFSDSENMSMVGLSNSMSVTTLLLPEDHMDLCKLRPSRPGPWNIEMLSSFRALPNVTPTVVPVDTSRLELGDTGITVLRRDLVDELLDHVIIFTATSTTGKPVLLHMNFKGSENVALYAGGLAITAEWEGLENHSVARLFVVDRQKPFSIKMDGHGKTLENLGVSVTYDVQTDVEVVVEKEVEVIVQED